MSDIAEIGADLAVNVDEQEEKLEDFNAKLEKAADNAEKANKELTSADKKHK